MKLILHYYFCQRIPLDFLQGDRFREAADSYIRPLLTKVYTNSLCSVLFTSFKIELGFHFVLYLGSSIFILRSVFFIQSPWEGQFYYLNFYRLYNLACLIIVYIIMVLENTVSSVKNKRKYRFWFCGFGFLFQADILEQLILELENSIRTTGQYPGR